MELTNHSTTSHRTYLLLLLIFSGMVLFYRLGTMPLLDRDETRYAVMAKGMIDRHDWVIPYLNNQPHPDKPPLFMWLVAISFKIFGVNEFSARLVPALMAIGTLFTVYYLGTLLWNPRTGFLAGIILLTSPGFFIPARFVITDMTLTFFTTLAITLIIAGLQFKKPIYYILSYVAFSGAMVTKGPVGIALPAIILLIYLWKQKQISRIKEMQLGWGILIIILLSLPWYLVANQRLPGYLYFFFIKENLLRFLTTQHQRSGPLYYYIPVAVLGLFPWIWFLPASLKKIKLNKQLVAWWEDAPRFFCFVWFAVGFIFFSLSGSKLPTYLLPYIAPVALLIACYWDKGLPESLSKALFLSYSIFLCIVGIILIYLGEMIPIEKLKPQIQLVLSCPMWSEAILIFLMGILPSLFFKQKKVLWSFTAIALCNIILIMELYLFNLGPKFAENHSTRAICQKLNTILQPDDEVVVYHPNRWSVSFYLNILQVDYYAENLDEIAISFSQSGKTYAVLENHSDTLYLQQKVAKPLHLLATEGNQELVSN